MIICSFLLCSCRYFCDIQKVPEKQPYCIPTSLSVNDVNKDIDDVDEPVPAVNEQSDLWRFVFRIWDPLHNINRKNEDNIAEDQD